MEKILVLGGTGAMGSYLVPELAEMGYQVDVVSLDDCTSENKQITYRKADGYSIPFLRELLKTGYDAVVDFLIYTTMQFADRFELFLENTGHYMFLSSYRIYAKEDRLITETSPRLLDVSEDQEFLKTEDYSLYKAREENILRSSKYQNWTILRPAITYSRRRFQLVTLEASTVVARAKAGKTVLLPQQAADVYGTMSWGGDVAKMIARLVHNPRAYGEAFTLATSEHHKWETIAEYYRELIGLTCEWVDTDTYLGFFEVATNKSAARYQLIYDRYFDRRVDNSKILEAAGMKQEELTGLKEGLKKELQRLPEGLIWPETSINQRMDAYLDKKNKRV